jgi:hypothetical protein
MYSARRLQPSVSAPVTPCTQTTHLLHHEGPAEEPHIFCRWIPVCSYTRWRPNPCACNSKWGFQKFVLGQSSINIWDSPLAFRRSPIASLWHLCARAVCLQLDTREDRSLAGIQHVAYTNEAISTNNVLKYKHSIFSAWKCPELHQIKKNRTLEKNYGASSHKNERNLDKWRLRPSLLTVKIQDDNI